jgi:hypothetical protein
MTDIYVYYRVHESDAIPVRAKVLSMQAELVARFKVSAALKRRSDEPQGLQTWMEIYEAAPEGFLTALSDAAQEARLPIDGERHVETFVDIPCA